MSSRRRTTHLSSLLILVSRFRWAKCQLDQIACLRNDKEIKRALKTLPPGLNETYERIVGGISEDDKELALRILRWLTCALRPLSVRELVEGIALELDDSELDPETLLNDPADIVEICGSLVQLDVDADTVTLGHFSVKEYFVARHMKTGPHSDYFIDIRESNFKLAKLCLTYLCLDHFRDGPCAEDGAFADRCGTWALYVYASKYWGPHAREHMDAEDMTFISTVRRLFVDEDMQGNFDAWMQVYEALKHFAENRISKGTEEYLHQKLRRQDKPLVYACALGLYSVAKCFLSAGIGDVQAQYTDDTTGYGNALNAACSSGSLEVVRLLVEAGADVNAMAGKDWLALVVAIRACEHRSGPTDFRVVEFLLQHGADVNRIMPGGNCPLYAVANDPIRSVEGVKLCLQAGADQSMRGSLGFTAFEMVGMLGSSDVFEVLRQSGGARYVHPNFAEHGTPGTAATIGVHELFVGVQRDFCESARRTLEENGEAIFGDPTVRRLLSFVWYAAAEKGYYRFIEQMLPYTDSSFLAIPDCIKLAASRGFPKTLRVLLDACNLPPDDGALSDMLVLAAGRGHTGVVAELLEFGVSPLCADRHGWTVDLVTQLTSLENPVDPAIFTDARQGIEPAVQKPSGWKMRPYEGFAEERPRAVFDGSGAYLPSGERLTSNAS